MSQERIVNKLTNNDPTIGSVGATTETAESSGAATIDHDRLFKLLIVMFFREFLELFLPEVAAYTDFSTLTPLDKETFSNMSGDNNDSHKTSERKRESDIVMQVRCNQQGQTSLAAQPETKYARKQGRAKRIAEATFAIHIENQATNRANFPRRMFNYFSRLMQRYNMDIYPVAILSFDSPRRPMPRHYRVRFPNEEVLNFEYDVIQLNRLDWRNYLNQPNPVASALMAKMQIAPEDRPLVKAHCTAMIFGLKLEEEQKQLITGFVETYLPLDANEKQVFESELERLVPTPAKENVMKVLNSWQKEGLEQGRREGLLEGELRGQRELALRQLTRKLGLMVRSFIDLVRTKYILYVVQIATIEPICGSKAFRLKMAVRQFTFLPIYCC